jgi:alpha-1,6-mannosyltransferase
VYVSGDPDACAAAVMRLLARDRSELRDAALNAARAIGTVEDHFEKVLDVYRDRLARRARA